MVAATGMNGPIREMTMVEKIPLSVAIITKDEAANLPGCLKSVAFARQIVVVDSGSADGTLEIARDFGCEVLVGPAEHIGGRGLGAEFCIERGDTCIITAEQSDFIGGGGKTKMGKRLRSGGLGQSREMGLCPAGVFYDWVN